MKLVRDNIPSIIKQQVGKCNYHACKNNEELLNYLNKKVFEEVDEFLKDPSVEELIDIITVAIAILKNKNVLDDSYSLDDIFVILENSYNTKARERGEFKKGYILE